MKEELKPFVVCNSLLSETSDILKADFDAKAYVEALTGRLVAESRTYDTQRSPNAGIDRMDMVMSAGIYTLLNSPI